MFAALQVYRGVVGVSGGGAAAVGDVVVLLLPRNAIGVILARGLASPQRLQGRGPTLAREEAGELVTHVGGVAARGGVALQSGRAAGVRKVGLGPIHVVMERAAIGRGQRTTRTVNGQSGV